MKLRLAIATIFFTLVSYTTPSIATPVENPKSFTEWCQQKSTLPPQTKHTVEALLKIAKTQNCKQANQKLTNLTSLELNSNKISDIKPLSALTNLNSLKLYSNEISDIKSLRELEKLTFIDIKNNAISPKICPVKPEYICHFD